MAKFKTGDPRINREGRPKGSPNKTTEEIRTAISNFMDANLETLQEDFDKLEPKDRLAFMERLLKYILPPLVVSLEQLSDSDLQTLLNKLRTQQNGHNVTG